jgi:Abortive infection C-terminus
MADMEIKERAAFEKLFGMASGYVLNFSNRTMAEFFADVVGIDIYDEKYAFKGDSKANRMRAFCQVESDAVVGTLLRSMVDTVEGNEYNPVDPQLKARCNAIADRLMNGQRLVVSVDQIKPPTPDREFSLLSAEVRDAIEKGRPEAALDRMHTFVVKYLRQLAGKHGIGKDESKSLGALMGEYAKILKSKQVIESDVSERILQTAVHIMEHYNHVRNRQSLAHDNTVIGSAESLLILNQITSTMRFIQDVENGTC